MAESLSTSQIGLAVPQDDMELGSDAERGPDMPIDADFEIDVDVDVTNDIIDVQDDYVLEDVRSDTEHRSEWQTDQVDDDLMQDEERDGLSMTDDATILDAEHEDVDLTQNLDNGVSLNMSPADLVPTHTTAETRDELPSQPATETVQGSARDSPNINHQTEAPWGQITPDHQTRPTQEPGQVNQEHSIAKGNLESAGPPSETLHQLSTSVTHEPGMNSTSNPTAGDNAQAADVSEKAHVEDQDYEEYTLPQGHNPRLHPVTVLYQEMEMSLFPPTVDDAVETYFLQDESLADSSISELLKAMRVVLADTVSEDDELELGMDALDLYLTEGSIDSEQTTLSQILDLYVKLLRNDGVEHPDPLYMTLTTRASCAKRLRELKTAVEEGKGISQLSLWDDQNPNTADDQPINDDDDEAPALEGPQMGSALEESLEEGGEVGYPQDEITATNGLEYSTENENDGLAAASDHPANKQLEPEHLVATSSQSSISDQGVPLNSTLPATSTEEDLGSNADQGDLPGKVAKDDARPAYDEDEINYEEDEKGLTGQSDINGQSTQTADDYDDHLDDACDMSAVAKPSLEGESTSGPARATNSARDNASNDTAVDLVADDSTAARDVAPQVYHEELHVEHQYDDFLAEEDLEDGLLVNEDEGQVSVTLDVGSPQGKLGPEADNITESWSRDDNGPTPHPLEPQEAGDIGGLSKGHELEDEITIDDGSELPQSINYEDPDELELDYNWAEGDDGYLDPNSISYTEEGDNSLTTQNELTTVGPGTSWAAPEAGSEGSATEAGDLNAEGQDTQWNTENAASNHDESGKGLQNDDRSTCSSTKRSRADNDEKDTQQASRQGPKRVRSK